MEPPPAQHRPSVPFPNMAPVRVSLPPAGRRPRRSGWRHPAAPRPFPWEPAERAVGARWAATPARRHVRGRDGARRRRAVAVEERPERALRGGERPRAALGAASALASLRALIPPGGAGPGRAGWAGGGCQSRGGLLLPCPLVLLKGRSGPDSSPPCRSVNPPAGPAAPARPGRETVPAGSSHPCRCPVLGAEPAAGGPEVPASACWLCPFAAFY